MVRRLIVIVLLCSAVTLTVVRAQAPQGGRGNAAGGRGNAAPLVNGLYNTAKAKLLSGKQIFSWTQSTFDVAVSTL